MKRAIVTSSLFLIAVISIAGCRSGGGDLSQAETQRRFGVRMAKMDLWREARFRFRRATEIDPSSAMAHNNLAVALEATGDYDAALTEYREALRLDRTNEYIQKNYSRFVEFSQRSKKKEETDAPPPATVTGTAGVAAAPEDAPAAEPAAVATPAPVTPEPVADPVAEPAPTPTAAQPAVTPPPVQAPPADTPPPPADTPPPPADTTNPPEER